MADSDAATSPEHDVAEAQQEATKERERETARQERAREKEAAKTGQLKGDALTYPRERVLAESSDLVGHEPHIVAGALKFAGITKQNMTRDEITEAVEGFLEHPVEEG
jgi:hypothetical protein